MTALQKNVAGQILNFQLNSRVDGSPITAGASGNIVIDNGSQAALTGTFAHKGTGQWTYAPTQAETNGTSLGLQFTATNAVNVGLQLFTIGQDPTQAGWVVATYTGNTPQTGDAYVRLGAPVGASTSADIASVQTDTTNIKTRIPAALTGAGNMKSDALAINGNTTAAANLSIGAQAVVQGTVGSSPSTTSIPTSALSPAAAVTDQFKGRTLIFDAATTTTALQGQATTITGNTSGGTLAVNALTTSPASGDIFAIY